MQGVGGYHVGRESIAQACEEMVLEIGAYVEVLDEGFDAGF